MSRTKFHPRRLKQIEARAERAALVKRRREEENAAAWHFLFTGESTGEPPYGKDWDRTYCPLPYPDAKPLLVNAEPDMTEYQGTGVGALYGKDDTTHHLWQLAGWTLTRQTTEEKWRLRRW